MVIMDNDRNLASPRDPGFVPSKIEAIQDAVFPRELRLPEPLMKGDILLIGDASDVWRASRALAASCGPQQGLVHLTSFTDWSISIWPRGRDFIIRNRLSGKSWRRRDIATAMLLGLPEFPATPEQHRELVFLEYSALLFALSALCDCRAHDRFRNICSGFSDEILELNEFNDNVRDVLHSAQWREACLIDERAYLRDEAGRITVIFTGPQSVAIPTWILRCENPPNVLPLVGVIPPWLPQMHRHWGTRKQRSVVTSSAQQRNPLHNHGGSRPGRLLLCGELSDGVLTAAIIAAKTYGLDISLLPWNLLESTSNSSFERTIAEGDPVILRAPAPPPVEINGDERRDHFRRLRLVETARTRVINRPSAGAINYSRIVNLLLLVELGWDVPLTLASNDSGELQRFALSQKNQLVKKPCSGAHHSMKRVVASLEESFDRAAECPIMLQEFIDGPEFRIHALRHAAVAISASSAMESRAKACEFSADPTRIPNAIRDLSTLTCKGLGLELVGLDVIFSEAARKLFIIEANSMPAFTSFGQTHSGDVLREIANTRS